MEFNRFLCLMELDAIVILRLVMKNEECEQEFYQPYISSNEALVSPY
jgi:hypothetical protein